jgi:hypothetical protein
MFLDALARVSMRLNSSGRCFGLSKYDHYDQIENAVWIFGPTPSRYARVVRSMANSCADLHLALAEADIFCLVSLFQRQGALSGRVTTILTARLIAAIDITFARSVLVTNVVLVSRAGVLCRWSFFRVFDDGAVPFSSK